MRNYLLLIVLMLLTACGDGRDRTIKDFNFDWRFMLGDDAAYATEGYDDSMWREIHLPHDWAIEGTFSADNPSTPSGGALPGGIGWYRKHFKTPAGNRNRVVLEFDGVFMNSTVWINGHEVGHRPYGYSSFCYDITPHLHPAGHMNIVAVRCDNSEQPNSRWYAGCGIYRNVRLVVTAPLHVAYCGTYVTTPEVTPEEATVHIETQVNGPEKVDFKLRQTLRDETGRMLATVIDGPFNSTDSICVQAMHIRQPKLWSPASPVCYNIETEVIYRGRSIDNYTTRFGIRTFRFTPDSGLILNGEPLKLKGVCLHHDLGALGAAVHRRAIERQLEILRDMGCNAIRTAHNPPAPELLDLCDSMGFVVMDEALDMWRKRKTTYDYARFFDEWHERDITDFIRRDRNHPSILMWSIGNEILEQWNHDDDSGELAAEQANLLMNFRSELPAEVADEMNPNVLMTIRLVDLVKSFDPTRPVTAGCNEPAPHNNLLRSGALDVIGYNYHETYYDSVRRWFPDKPLIGSETASAIQSRGFYIQPSTTEIVQPEHWWEVYDTPHHQCSAYDHSRVPWGATHEKAWIAVRDRDFVAGTFVWTGFDYLGEPTPYSWPSRSSYFGIVDLCGFPKDVYYMYRSEWSDSTTLHLFPHWNWQRGDKIDIWAYYNQADEVELLVNGKSLGRQSKSPDRLHCIWPDVAFEPGEITAISYRDGMEVTRTTRRTAGKVASLRLTVDRPTIVANGYDLAYVTIEALDEADNPVPTAMNELTFWLRGAGEIIGVDNGNAAGGQRLRGRQISLFHGKALAIIRSLNGSEGEIELIVRSNNLRSSVTIESTPPKHTRIP